MSPSTIIGNFDHVRIIDIIATNGVLLPFRVFFPFSDIVIIAVADGTSNNDDDTE